MSSARRPNGLSPELTISLSLLYSDQAPCARTDFDVVAGSWAQEGGGYEADVRGSGVSRVAFARIFRRSFSLLSFLIFMKMNLLGPSLSKDCSRRMRTSNCKIERRRGVARGLPHALPSPHHLHSLPSPLSSETRVSPPLLHPSPACVECGARLSADLDLGRARSRSVLRLELLLPLLSSTRPNVRNRVLHPRRRRRLRPRPS